MTKPFGVCFLFLLVAGWLRADQVELKNGDRYLGNVLSLTPDALVLQSEVLGKLVLPRSKVATITFGPAPTSGQSTSPTNALIHAPQGAIINTNSNLAAALGKLGGNTNFIGQVREQFLNGAGPEANKKFDDTLNGLMNGKLDLNSLRAEAKSSADQLRALKHDLGNEGGESLDAYLDILENFLKETAPDTNKTGQ